MNQILADHREALTINEVICNEYFVKSSVK